MDKQINSFKYRYFYKHTYIYIYIYIYIYNVLISSDKFILSTCERGHCNAIGISATNIHLYCHLKTYHTDQRGTTGKKISTLVKDHEIGFEPQLLRFCNVDCFLRGIFHCCCFFFDRPTHNNVPLKRMYGSVK